MTFAPNQRQTWLAAICPQASPAAVNQLQACELGRGDVSPVLSRISHWSLLLATDRRKLTSRSHRLNFPAARHCAERGAFHSVRVVAAKRSHAHILPVEQVFQGIAYRKHHHRLSSFAVSVGIDPNENGLMHAYKSLPSRGKAHV